MRALLCARPRELTLVERPAPLAAPGAPLVRIRRAGVCGTDLHIFEGSQPYFEYPRVIGHELAGEIAELAGPSRFRLGQQVSIIPYLFCGTCVACRRGKPNCCQRINVVGVHSDGGMADWLTVPEDNLVDAEGVGLDEAAMAEFLAIGAHAVRRGAIEPGQRVVISGAGPIGLATAIFARASGAQVTMLDKRADRLAFAAATVGVEHVVEANPGARDEMAKLTDGDFFDCAFDCTGSPAAMAAGFSLVAHGGAYVLVSIVLGDISFSDPEFHKRETTLLGSRNATRQDFDTVFASLRGGAIPSRALATHRASLDEAARLFPHWLDPANGVVKALIEV
ncbi:MAG: zinc-binding alcohol dehydrogenase family protein [Bradyrhizobium sp.]|nr:MAG: zinc-binding alcohol dehydrogenase family protein [Bradyrhizobium sp.]